MDLLQALILGIVEGITEFLPISSTGHLILTSTLLHIPDTEFSKTFEIVIQLGAILAVVALYFKDFFDWEVLKRIVVAFVPTGIIGLALYKIVKTYLLGNDIVVLWALALGGIALIAFELLHTERESAVGDVRGISYVQAAMIGLFQSLAIIPGISRSAATIVGGLAVGIKRATIVEFSFLLAVPTMAAASGLDLLKTGFSLSGSEWAAIAVGFAVSFVIAMIAIKWLLSYVRGHSFISFGVYRILVALAFFLLIVR